MNKWFDFNVTLLKIDVYSILKIKNLFWNLVRYKSIRNLIVELNGGDKFSFQAMNEIIPLWDATMVFNGFGVQWPLNSSMEKKWIFLIPKLIL